MEELGYGERRNLIPKGIWTFTRFPTPVFHSHFIDNSNRHTPTTMSGILFHYPSLALFQKIYSIAESHFSNSCYRFAQSRGIRA